MDFNDLSNKIIENINNSNNNYSFIIIPVSYDKHECDIKKLGVIIRNKYNLDKNTNDIIESFFDDYFIFKFNNIYIIINVNQNEYKVIKVLHRCEALTYRFG